ncbi:MAG: 50S ribosomal protein L23 [Flavobacteriales bacterium]|nr:50S ribosomal protein L23 [Flavobacteriales bacterium]
MSIVVKPVISEKANNESEVRGRYTFLVNPKANKIQIKESIKELYGVDVVNVRTMIYAPNVKTKYTKKGLQVGKTNKLKKAIVEVGEGQSIDVYGNI